jgi:hypothetical protein
VSSHASATLRSSARPTSACPWLILLSEVADVTAYDIDESRLELLGRGQSPIDDPDIERLPPARST